MAIGLTSFPKRSVSRPSRRFDFTPYPTGWYRATASRDIRPAQARPLRCFGRELVLFRTADKTVGVLDAHCPHLGAHLGHGGRVVDGSVVCPFHGWRFNAAGHCVMVPDAAIVPSRASLRAWQVQEANGAIMVWFDEAGRRPLWDVPVLPESQSAGWTRFRSIRPRKVRTHVQELAENGVDLAHFTAIHGGQISRAESDGLTIEGPALTHRIRNGFTSRIHRITQLLGVTAGDRGRLPGLMEFSYHGLGTMVCRAEVTGRFPVSFITVLYFLPLDEDTVHVSGDIAIRRCGLLTRPLLALAARETEHAVVSDTAILENKVYLSRPRLSDADGPIMQYRKWAQQFYPLSLVDAVAD